MSEMHLTESFSELLRPRFRQPDVAVALCVSIQHIDTAHEFSVEWYAAGLRGGPTPPSSSQSTL